jgi:hypothetical protein
MNTGALAAEKFKRIPASEVEFHRGYLGDPNGRLFTWRGDLYRGIAHHRADFYLGLFESGIVRRLIETGHLVTTDLTDLQLDGYALVLKHRRILFVSYPFCWSGAMLKDAALLTLDLDIELARYGLMMQDAHPFNVLFDGCRPQFVDFTAIVPAGERPVGAVNGQFRRTFTWPLQMMARGHGRIARSLLREPDLPIFPDEVALVDAPGTRWLQSVAQPGTRWLGSVARRIIPPGPRAKLRGLTSRPLTLEARIAHLQKLRVQTGRIRVPFEHSVARSDTERSTNLVEPTAPWTQKQLSVHRVLTEKRPRTVLSARSEQTWFPVCAAKLGGKVVAFDPKEETVARLHALSKSEHLDLLALVMDVRDPSPGMGLCNQAIAPATQRFRCEMVLALDLIPELIFKRDLNPDQIVEALAQFTERWLVLEFFPWEDPEVRRFHPEENPFFPRGFYDWYSLDGFTRALARHFTTIESMPSDAKGRVLLLCER